ncbi:MAG TPA: hypothetical protein VE820_13325, partial [Sphingomicrobium sp.]|nr:hypothetical protein [Sphingomicrobium sp.]
RNVAIQALSHSALLQHRQAILVRLRVAFACSKRGQEHAICGGEQLDFRNRHYKAIYFGLFARDTNIGEFPIG